MKKVRTIANWAEGLEGPTDQFGSRDIRFNGKFLMSEDFTLHFSFLLWFVGCNLTYTASIQNVFGDGLSGTGGKSNGYEL